METNRKLDEKCNPYG